MAAYNRNRRDITFDMMKGIGILLMLVGHILPTNIIFAPPLFNVFCKIIYSFHMPLFLIIAGYFSKPYSSDNNNKSAIYGYLLRLLPPFIFTVAITVLFFSLIGIVKHDWNPAIQNIISLFWADVNILHTPYGDISIGVIWFLLALLWAKIFLLLLLRWEKWILPISFILSIGTLLLHKIFPYSVWCLSLGLVCLSFVTIGWWCRYHNIPLWLRISSIILWIVAICFSKLDIYDYTWECYPLDVIGACGGTYFVYLLCKGLNSDLLKKYFCGLRQVLAYLGVISLAVMCCHCFELSTHLGNRIFSILDIKLSVLGMVIYRYILTITFAVIIVHIPKLKKIFL